MKFLWSSFSRDLQRAVWAGSALAALLLFGANCFGQAQELAFTNRGGINKVWRTIEGSIYLSNGGHRPATNIRIEVEGPPGWIAKVQPEFIDSVPPDVNIISFVEAALTRPATASRVLSRAALASSPSWCGLEGLP